MNTLELTIVVKRIDILVLYVSSSTMTCENLVGYFLSPKRNKDISLTVLATHYTNKIPDIKIFHVEKQHHKLWSALCVFCVISMNVLIFSGKMFHLLTNQWSKPRYLTSISVFTKAICVKWSLVLQGYHMRPIVERHYFWKLSCLLPWVWMKGQHCTEYGG